jgi:hypothetical protein
MRNLRKNPPFLSNSAYKLFAFTTNKYFGIAATLFILFGGFLNLAAVTQAQTTCPASCLPTAQGAYCTNGVACKLQSSFAGNVCPNPGAYKTPCVVAATSASPGSSNVICSIVGIYNTVVTAIFILGIMLMILGGALYAGSHLMPGSTKGSLQGYGMGMILGGIIGIIIAVLAPFILSVITGSNVTSYVGGATSFAGCPT